MHHTDDFLRRHRALTRRYFLGLLAAAPAAAFAAAPPRSWPKPLADAIDKLDG